LNDAKIRVGGEDGSMRLFAYRIRKGFTLAELLVSLAVLGVIATFTIPKVLTSVTYSQQTAIGKSVISSITEAYQAYKINNTLTTDTKPSYLMPYFNYVKDITLTAQIVNQEDPPNSGTCGSSYYNKCILLHNGAIIAFDDTDLFDPSNVNKPLWFLVDTDGKYSTDLGGFWVAIQGNGRLEVYKPAWFNWN
jgi:prepilin-type N-terminal cleavage/methylation domain-containing protein